MKATGVLAASLLGVLAVGWSHGADEGSRLSRAHTAVQAGGSCPLTSAQQLNSVKTFEKMMPVFRHPRCFNCHGAMPSPLPRRDNHGRFPSLTVQHAGIVEMDTTDDNRTCEQCHVEDWGGALGAPPWIDRSDMDICRGMHVVFEGDAPRFMAHIERDGGGTPFIELAFQGKRGLTDAGQTNYEADRGRPLTAEPPPGSHAQLIQMARAWVAAQGGQFVGDRDCGCVVDRVEVFFHSTMTITGSGPRKDSTAITGEGSTELKLGPDLTAPDWDVATEVRGEKMKLTWSSVSVTPSDGCQIIIDGSPATDAKLWFGMSYSPEVKLSLELVPGMDKHANIRRCRNPASGGWISARADSIPHIFLAAWTALHGHGTAAGAPTLDPARLQAAMDPARLRAVMEAMRNGPPTDPARMKALMNQLVPGASQMAAAAKNNYRFAIPDGRWCTTGNGADFIARCEIRQTVTVADNLSSLVPGGTPTTQTITEATTITIGKPSPVTP